MASRNCSCAALILLMLQAGSVGPVFSQEIVPAKPKARTNGKEPASNPMAVQIRTSVMNGVRMITVVGDEEKVEITDKGGKEITVKHTRMVAGKPETTEHKADNLEALKGKSRLAAALYEKYAGAPRQPVGGMRPLAVPPPVPVNGRAPIQAQFFLNDDPELSRPGPRRIRVELKDRRIEIYDGAGAAIRINIVKRVDDKDQIEEVLAENLVDLMDNHPELGRLYEKYTGINTH
ncbi:hypothetical protein [Schlesneria paludicola]|uniref:hypothetical protein n=1 Tax=Schlesneria paludicola TaxID=360056 RepID=UPI000299F534|nr:hypothetical protein [Schlesneria paludicola]